MSKNLNFSSISLCPVCLTAHLSPFLEVSGTRYHRCPHCLATVMDPASRLNLEAERAIYELHENDPADAGYRAYMRRLFDPLVAQLKPGLEGLDFGCGPGSALAAMLEEQGFTVSRYDPLFAPDQSVLERQYDFITCTEVAEHFFEPRQEFERMNGLLKPGGLLAIMTTFLTDDTAFAHWHYRRDPTHVVFYKPETLQALARQLGWSSDIPVPNVALLRKH